MRKLLPLLLILTGICGAQTTQIYTGTVKDLTGAVVTSGRVTFTLAPSTESTITGTGAFVSSIVSCAIQADGTLKANDGVSACTVVPNISLTPTGTSYRICIQPYFSTPGSCFYDYALGGTKDISSIVPTLPTGPINYTGSVDPGVIDWSKITNQDACVHGLAIDANGNVTLGGCATFKTNSVLNADQSLLNFTDTATIHWTNPSGGVEEANCQAATSSQIGCVLATDAADGFQNYTLDPLGTQSVVVPFTVATNNDDGGGACFVISDATSGEITMQGSSNLGCQAPPGPSITWRAPVLPTYIDPANVTAIYAVGTVGYTGFSQVLNLTCFWPTSSSVELMNDGDDTGVMKAYSAVLTGATGANFGSITCVANVAANSGGAGPLTVMNIANIQLRVYYTGTAPPASTKLNLTSPLYLNTALNALGVAAINLAGSGDGGVIGTLPLANGGTNGTTAAAALSNLLGNPAAGNYAVNCTSTTSCSPVAGTGAVVQSAHLGASSCSPAGTSYATCTSSLTWPAAFADTSYYASCALGPVTGGSGSQSLLAYVSAQTTTTVTVTVQNNTSDAGTSASDIYCIGVHN